MAARDFWKMSKHAAAKRHHYDGMKFSGPITNKIQLGEGNEDHTSTNEKSSDAHF
jgi:hypothetical protein